MTFHKIFTSSTFLYGAAGAILYWAALPPVDFWPLAWIAPVPWILLIRRKELEGPRPYLALWTVGFSFWLAALHWLRLPHPMLAFAWIALACYFAYYVPVFVGLSRIAVHRLRWPAMLAAPTVWAGLELARTHLLTGMSMGDISHTQYRWTTLIQIADLAGQFGVDFVILFVAACFAQMLPCEKRPKDNTTNPNPLSTIRRNYRPLLPAVLLLMAVLAYGYWRTSNIVTRPGPCVALIQGSIDSESDKEDFQITRNRFYDHYFELSQKAVAEAAKQAKTIDLIVWPEIFFKDSLFSHDADACERIKIVKSGEKTAEECRDELERMEANNRLAFVETTRVLGAPMVIGLDSWHFSADDIKFYNSAAYLSKTGELLGRYDKMHLVPFGEYIPFADVFPWLYNGLTPLSGGMTHGKQPAAMELHFSPLPLGEGQGVRAELGDNTRIETSSIDEKNTGDETSNRATALTPNTSPIGRGETILFAPNICYETVLSREIRGQINVLQAKNREPDLLVNLSNDGWYWSSSELDMLFACSVFRAVECRKPYVIAANTGFSGSIDADGRVLLKGPRHDAATLLADVRLDSRRSPYLQYGDWPAGICLAACIYFAAIGCWRSIRERRERKKNASKSETCPRGVRAC